MSWPRINLKVMLLNGENFFLLSDHQLQPEHTKLDEIQWQKFSTSIFSNKPLQKLRDLARVISAEKPDLILLCEVGGLESMTRFNELFLNHEYACATVEGNSDRHIHVGFYIRKGHGFYFDLISNRHRPIHFLYPHEKPTEYFSSHKFSRDVAELHLFQTHKDRPFLIFLLTHLKSRLDPEGIDPQGFLRRRAEFNALLNIYKEQSQRYHVPIAVCGDMNGNASPNQTDSEFAQLYESTELKDVCDLAQLTGEQRHTYFQVHPQLSKSEGKQIDFAFLSPDLAPHLDLKSVFVYRYLDENGNPYNPPTSLEEKAGLPSDHYPLFFTLKDLIMR